MISQTCHTPVGLAEQATLDAAPVTVAPGVQPSGLFATKADGCSGIATARQENGKELEAHHLGHLSRDNAYTGLPNASTNSRQIPHWTEDLESRLVDHQAGRGARLMAVIKAAGIDWKLRRLDRRPVPRKATKTRAAPGGTAPNAA
jgi:hypothetical protein